MKMPDWWEYLAGGAGTLITAAGLRLTWLKLGDERRKDRAAAAERLRLQRAEAESTAAAQWREIAKDREAEIGSLRTRLDHLQETVDALRQEMREAIDKRDATIDLLRGENRQLKQLAGSASRNPQLWPDTPATEGDAP